MQGTQDNSVLNDIFQDLLKAPVAPQPPIENTTGLDPLAVVEQPTNVTVPTDEKDNNVNPSAQDDAPVDPESPEAGTSNWDDFIPETQDDKPTANLDWTQIGKSIGVEDAKTSEDVVGYVENLRKSVEEYKSKSASLEDVPTELREAIEIAKQNGDYLSYLDIGKIDYSQVDPLDLYEDEVAEYFYNPDGSFRQEEFDSYLNRQDEFDMKLKGTQIQKALIAEQEHQKHLLKQRIAAEKAENLRKLESSLNEFKKVGEFEVTPKAKKQLYSDLTSGKFMDKMGINPMGSHNWNTLLNTYFKAMYFDAIVKFNQTQSKNETLRKEMSKVGNHTVNRPSTISNPTQEVKKNAVDLYFEKQNIKK